MKREIKIIPLVLSILGLFATGLSFGALHENTSAELLLLTIFGGIAFTFILLLSVGFPFTTEEKKDTKIVW